MSSEFTKTGLVAGLIVLFAAGCARDTYDIRNLQQSGSAISFDVTANGVQDGAQTRSVVTHDPFMLTSEDGSEVLSLTVTETPNTEMNFQSADIITKGTPVTTENIGTVYGSFKTTAFTAGSVATPAYITDETVTYTSGNWQTANKYRWPVGSALDFYAYAPEGITGLTDISYPSSGSMSFSYELPAAAGKQTDGTYIDAANQKDLLFAITPGAAYDKDNAGKVKFTFEHALAAIRFECGTVESAGKLQSITLKNLSSKGTATATYDETDEKVAFTWTDQDSQAKTYSQSFGLDINAATTGTTTQQVTAKDESKTFMMIPQEIDGTTTILELTFQRTGESPIVMKAAVPEIEWKAGYVYTYRINPEDVLSIEVVEESVSGSVKNNVSVANTGNMRAFLRVAVVGNWNVGDNATGAIIDKWSFDPNNTNPTKTGTVTGFNSKWVKNGDYYYYTEVVNPASLSAAADAPVLFTKFEAPKHSNGTAHLDMHIIAQAIAAGTETDYAKAWAAVLPTSK